MEPQYEVIAQLVREHNWMWNFMCLSTGIHFLTLVGMGWLIVKFERSIGNYKMLDKTPTPWYEKDN